jgi:TolB protein
VEEALSMRRATVLGIGLLQTPSTAVHEAGAVRVRVAAGKCWEARAVVLGLSLLLAGCEQPGSVSSAASSTNQAPTAAATVPATEEPTSQATIPVANGQIAFRRFLSADKTTGAIFTINPDGTGLQQVTSGRRKDGVGTEPSWSPDGEWIVYMVAPGGDLGRARLAKIRPDGTDATELSEACTGRCLSDGFPAFAPSGQLLAFERKTRWASGEGESTAIFVMDADGANARQITQQGSSSEHPTQYEDLAPTFAPSGARIAFERTDLDTFHHAIFTVALDGTGELQITDWSLDASQPDFSPDGEWILFRSNETSPIEGNVWLVRPDGTDAHAVTDSVEGDAKWVSGSFSPDGLFITNGMAPIVDGQQQNADVYVMRPDGSELRNLTDDPDFWDSSPEWGPAS